MTHRTVFSILLALCFLPNLLLSQLAWSLEDCINYALENNINVLRSSLNIELAENQVFQDKMNMYTPLVNADISHSFNFAASVNPLTYSFTSENTQSTRMGIVGSVSLFEGGSRLNNLKSDQDNLSAVTLEMEELKNNTKLLVANYYLQILIANEVLGVANEKLNLSKVQLANTNELVSAGIRAKGDVLELESQKANDELGVLNAEINLQKAMNQLKLLLQLDPYSEFSIQSVDVSTNDEVMLQPQMIASQAMESMPNLQAAKYRLMSAEKGLKSTKGLLSPTLSFSAYIGTNYFSAAQDVVGETNLGQVPIGIVNSSGDVVNSLTEFSSPVFGDLSFGQQFGNNFNQNVSLNLSVPIFGKWQRMTAIDNSKINLLSAQYDIESKQNDLQQEVFNAYTDMTAAGKRYEVSSKSLSAAQEAFTYANEKFNAGLMNALELETSKNRLVSTQAEVIQAKYEYAFRKMIVNFYQTGNVQF